MNDSYGRNIHYLRVSLTDRCNLRCVYCMPADMKFAPLAHLLQDDELIRLVRIATSVGFDRVRLTGGEPLMRKDLFELAGHAVSLGIRQTLSTNGTLITREVAQRIKDLGFTYVGIGR